MPIERDFKAYHKSIADELLTMKDRIRQLIGSAHWQTDGEHKEAVLRKLLRNHVAQSLQIGRGFVCGEGDTSSQIDVLVTHRDKPTLFRDGEMLLVTPDAVAAIIEVKTRVRTDLEELITKLATDVAMIRDAGNHQCLAGLFVYEPFDGAAAHERLLTQVQAASQGNPNRVINWIAAGPDVFVRHWSRGTDVRSPVAGPVWHSYLLEDLSHAYLISNVVWDTCARVDPAMQYAWFPVEGTKERHRKRYIALDGAESHAFEGP